VIGRKIWGNSQKKKARVRGNFSLKKYAHRAENYKKGGEEKSEKKTGRKTRKKNSRT
jgi:hypothetical protein